jgi:RsiW-degrading membrane proteinase PrsW (M82 family)
VAVFVWGFAVASVLSLVFNSIILRVYFSSVATVRQASFLTAVAGAPVVEEVAKGFAVFIVFGASFLLLAQRWGTLRFAGVTDGIVYGSAVGFGFSLVEDLLYYAQFGPEVFVVRRIFGGFAHAAFTSLAGIGIGLAPWVRSCVWKLALPVLGLAGAILLHALFNFTAPVYGGVAYLILLVVLLGYVVLVIGSLASQRRTICQELREEVGRGTISEDEYEILSTYFRRTLYYLGLVLRGRLGLMERAQRVHRAAVDLAFTKRLVRSSRVALEEPEVQKLRERVARGREDQRSLA